MKNQYLLVDTNNFIECFEYGYKNVEQDVRIIEGLLLILNGNKITLLLPEIVKLEVERLLSEKQRELGKVYSNICENIEIDSPFSKKQISKAIREIKEDYLKNFEIAKQILFKTFNHKNTKTIELTNTIFLSAYKRSVTGKKPFKKIRDKRSGWPFHEIQPDCLIIESVKSYLNDIKNYEFYICTKDPDFYESESSSKIHPDIKKEFKKIKSYKRLSNFLVKKFNLKDIPEVISSSKKRPKEKDQAPKNGLLNISLDDLIRELEYSSSFDEARRNMENLLSIRKYLDYEHIEKILEAILSNPKNYTLNQVLAVDNEQSFTKKLFMYYGEKKKIWRKFADNLILTYDDNPAYLKNYNWLFERLGMEIYQEKPVSADDIPF